MSSFVLGPSLASWVQAVNVQGDAEFCHNPSFAVSVVGKSFIRRIPSDLVITLHS